jgi:hypothetical protein
MSIRRLAVAAALTILSCWPASSIRATDEQTARSEAVRERIAEMKERLQLTPEQEATIRPIVEAHLAQLRELRSSLNAQSTAQQKRDVARRARTLHTEFATQVDAHLTPEQRATWKTLRGENRERLRGAARKRRGV